MSYAVNKSLNNGETLTFSPKWIYNITNGGVDNGSNIISNYEAIQKYGALTTSEYKYCEENKLPDYKEWSTNASDWLKAQRYSIDNNNDGYCYSKLDISRNPYNNTLSDTAYIDSLKTAINEGNVLNISYYSKSAIIKDIKRLDDASNKEYYEDKVSSNYNNEKIIQYIDSSKDGGHAVTIVGYDDTIWTDINNDNKIQPSELGTFKFANSWGVTANDTNNGFCWVSYDALNKVSQVPAAENASDDDLLYKNSRTPFSSNDFVTWITSPSIKKEIPPIYAEFTLNTNIRTECSVSLSAKNINTNEITTYTDFTPFEDNKFGYLSFDGSYNKKDGSFAIDLSKVIPNIDSDSLKSYTWTLTVKDTKDDDNCVLVKNFKIVDSNIKDPYTNDFPSPISLDNSSVDITINPNNNELTINKQPPAVNIASVCINSPNDIPLNKIVNIHCIAYDGNKNNYKFKIVNNSTGTEEYFDAGDKNNINWVPKAIGTHSVSVSVTDSFGNTDTFENALYITVNEEIDVENITAPKNLSYSKNDGYITLNWDSDNNSNIKEYYIYKNGKLLGTTKTNSFTDTTPNKFPAYKYTVRAVNNDGLYKSSDIDVPIIKDCICVFTLDDDNQKEVSTGDTLRITVDSAGYVGKVKYYCEFFEENDPEKTTELLPSTETDTFIWKAPAPGVYYINFSASDSNNSSSNIKSIKVKVLDKKTIIENYDFSLNGLAFDENYSTNNKYNYKNVILQWTKDKNYENVEKYKIYCDDEYIGETTERIFRTKLYQASNHNYNYKVLAIDKNGNTIKTSNIYTVKADSYGVYVTMNNQEITSNNILIKAGDLINFSINVYGDATGIDYSYELDSIDGSMSST